MKKYISLLIVLTTQLCYADTFQINYTQYALRFSAWTVLALSNNYFDNNLISKPSEQDINNLDPDKINWFDQIGLVDYSQNLKDISDYTIYANMFVASWLAYKNDNFFDDMLIFSESLIAQDAIGKWTKTLSGRYRPFVYSNSVSMKKKRRPNSQHSFYSLHSSVAFSTATFGYHLYYHNHGHNLLYATILYATAAGTAALRVVSAQHFPTDVIFGAIMGSSITYLICQSYKNPKVRINVTQNSLGFQYNF